MPDPSNAGVVADFAAINAAEGRAFTFTPAGASGSTVTGIWSLLGIRREGRIETRFGRVQLLPTIATAPSMKDRFTIDGVTYAPEGKPVREVLVVYNVVQEFQHPAGGGTTARVG